MTTVAEPVSASPPRRSVPLAAIIERLEPVVVRGDPSGVVVTGVTYDHRRVEPGSLHCCIKGARVDGRSFAGAACAAGAVALLADGELAGLGAEVVQLIVAPERLRTALALAACCHAGDPAAKLSVVGVTGTNGKTTTVELLGAILSRDGRSVRRLGTLTGTRTTPEAPDLQSFLADSVAKGVEVVVMEVTSHGIGEHRVDGFLFDLGVFTNLSQDHLDYHATLEEYFGVKAQLFQPDHSRRAVVCVDDRFGRRLAQASLVPTEVFSLADVDALEVGLEESRFVWNRHPVRLSLGGVFNVANAIAAATAARALQVSDSVIAAGLSEPIAVAGRFELLGSPVSAAEGDPHDGPPRVIIDFAHTPAALEGVLKAVRAAIAPAGKLIAVFGCGGDRDRAKRPLMGAVAAALADVVVLTSDNPRSEPPLEIIEEIRGGCGEEGATILVEQERAAAIGLGINLGRAGDVVVIAGKGHEKSQEVAGRFLPFDDRAVALGHLGRADPSRAPQSSARSAPQAAGRRAAPAPRCRGDEHFGTRCNEPDGHRL